MKEALVLAWLGFSALDLRRGPFFLNSAGILTEKKV